MWDARKGEKEYKQWAAYRTKTEIMRDEKGEIVRDSQGRPMQGEVLDFGTKKVYDDGYETAHDRRADVPRETSTISSTTSSRTCTGAISCGIS